MFSLQWFVIQKFPDKGKNEKTLQSLTDFINLRVIMQVAQERNSSNQEVQK